MAVFGFQLCYTLIMASFLQKVAPIHSFGSWLLSNGSLFRFLHPTDQALKKLSGKDYTRKIKGSAKKRSAKSIPAPPDKNVKETFKVPRNADIELETTPLQKNDVLLLNKYSEYEWLVDYVMYAILVYVGTEIYLELWQPKKEFNISLVWLLLAVCFVCRNLVSIMTIYIKSASGELSLSLSFGFFSFVAAMGILVANDNILEFGLNTAYESFAHNSYKLLPKNSTGPEGNAPVSLRVIKVFLALISGLTGTLLVFPGMRIAQMYVDALKYSKNKFLQFCLHISYFSPLLIVFLWIKPIARDILCIPKNETITNRGFLTHDQFDIIRIMFVIFLFFLRLLLARTHLQAYLNTAYLKMKRMKKEAGYTSNSEIQTTVSGVFYYLGIVALQYISPIILIGCAAMTLKTMGEYSWKQILPNYTANATTPFIGPQQPLSMNNVFDENFGQMVQKAGVTLSQLSAVFTPLVFRGILSFYIWWLCLSMFVASSMGVVYHTYLVLY